MRAYNGYIFISRNENGFVFEKKHNEPYLLWMRFSNIGEAHHMVLLYLFKGLSDKVIQNKLIVFHFPCKWELRESLNLKSVLGCSRGG